MHFIQGFQPNFEIYLQVDKLPKTVMEMEYIIKLSTYPIFTMDLYSFKSYIFLTGICHCTLH